MRTPTKILATGLFASMLLPAAASAFSFDPAASIGALAGSLFSRLGFHEPAAKGKVFGNNLYQSGGAGGQVVSNVNLFTGQPSYSVPIYTLSARGEVAFPITLNFSGPTVPTVTSNNDKAPSGWIGSGWSLNVPFVAIDHRGTFAYTDDVVLCNLGSYGGGQILREPETGRYFVSTNPAIKVSLDTVSNSSSDLYRQIEAWRFELPGGIKLVFGDTLGSEKGVVSNSERVMQYNKGLITASPYSATKPFIYRWDLRRLEGPSGKSRIDFEYEKIQESLWGGRSYTRESYIKKAAWLDEYGNEIQSVRFGLDDLETLEYQGFFPNQAKTSQPLFETKRLLDVKVYSENRQQTKYVLQEDVRTYAYGRKRRLGGIDIYHGETEKQGPGWTFNYYSMQDNLLNYVKLPSLEEHGFEYALHFLDGTDGGQEPGGGTIFRSKTGATVVPPADGTGWAISTNCDGRFCFQTVYRSVAPETTWVKVLHNTGNYFRSTPVFEETYASQVSIIPQGDYFLAVKSTANGTVDMWEWDGKAFKQADNDIAGMGPSDPMRSDFGGEISVYPMGTYFLVYKKNATRKIWVYMKDPLDGRWENKTYGDTTSYPTGACEIHNPKFARDAAGALVTSRPAGTECFTWSGGLMVAAGPRMFIVNDTTNRTLYAYALNSKGTRFEFVSPEIEFFSSGVQTTYPSGGQSPAKWVQSIRSIQMSGEYIAIKDYRLDGAVPKSRYQFLFYDGTAFKRIGQLPEEVDYQFYKPSNGSKSARNLYLMPDYFVHMNIDSTSPTVSRRIEYWRRVQDNDSIFFQNITKLGAINPRHDTITDVRIMVSPRFISVEMYGDSALINGATPIGLPGRVAATGSLASWLYRVNRAGTIDTVDTAAYTYHWPSTGCYNKIFDMEFGSDDVMIGYAFLDSDNGCVFNGGNVYMEKISVKLNNDSDSFFQTTLEQPDVGSSTFAHSLWSTGRIGQAMYLKNSSPRLFATKNFYFNGQSFENDFNPPYVVSGFTRKAAPGMTGPNATEKVEFAYGKSGFITEFNHNALTPQFEYVKVTRKGMRGGREYTFYVDYPGHMLAGDSVSLLGRVRTVTTLDSAGDTLSLGNTQYLPPYTRGYTAGVRNSVTHPWPRGVTMNRAGSTASVQKSKNRSRRTASVRYHAYNDTLESPLFTVTDQGNKILVSQSILDAGGTKLKKALTYEYPDSTAFNESWFASRTASTLPIDASKGMRAVGYSEVTYDAAFTDQVDQTIGWRNAGGTWTDEQLKNGPIPTFDPASDTFVASEVTQRDALGLPREILTENDGGQRVYTSIFYEGRAALPVGAVENARQDNAAILTAENGSVPQLLGTYGKLDREGIWSPPGVTYDSLQVHTGRYSFKVVDHFGPSGNLYLKDVTGEGLGFVASAWIYGDTDDAPIFSVSRRHANNNEQNEVRGAPVDGSYVRGKWQRWEARLSHADLTANGMFADGSGDYLRFFFGNGSTGSNSSRVMYVDDIVLRPDNSTFSLTAYNERGQVTHTTSPDHRTTTTEYGQAGQPIGTRDERGRVFGQGGFNKVGEN
jgi:YD repeat-containing protein